MKGYRNSSWYIKEYSLSNLLCTEVEIRKRYEIIKRATSLVETMPRTIFEFQNEDILLVKQWYIVRDNILAADSLIKLAQDLDSVSLVGFIHGDINKTNVLLNNGKFYLIDFEPCFKQFRNGIKVTMSSKFTRSLIDKENGQITSLTDKVGFYKICSYYMNKSSIELKIADELELHNMNFIDILNNF